MLDVGSALKTWALDRAPECGDAIGAKSLPDHRLAYLDHEGAVSGGRGTVVRWDQGGYRIERETPTLWIVVLDGEKLQGRATLERSSDAGDRWEFSFTCAR